MASSMRTKGWAIPVNFETKKKMKNQLLKSIFFVDPLYFWLFDKV